MSVMDKIKNVFLLLDENTYGEHVNRVTKRARIFVGYQWKIYTCIGIFRFDRCMFLFYITLSLT